MAMFMDTNGQKATIASNAALDLTGNDFAFSLWTQGASAGAYQMFMTRGDTTSGFFFLYYNSPYTIYFQYFASGSPTTYEVTPDEDLSAGGLYHIFMAKYSGNLYFYVNGALVDSAVSYTTDSPSISASLEIGSSAAYNQPHLGSLADVRVYVSPAWIAAHASIAQTIYNEQGDDGITEGMVVRLPFDGTDGATITATENIGSLATQPGLTGSPVFKKIQLRGGC